jgi:hypothetical protein
VPRGFGFVHHSIAILYHEVPNPNLTIRNFLIAVHLSRVGWAVRRQGLDDHAHIPTLELLPKTLPVIASPSAAAVATKLGFTQVVSLAPGKTWIQGALEKQKHAQQRAATQ